jgi:hypothetical protein
MGKDTTTVERANEDMTAGDTTTGETETESETEHDWPPARIRTRERARYNRSSAGG